MSLVWKSSHLMKSKFSFTFHYAKVSPLSIAMTFIFVKSLAFAFDLWNIPASLILKLKTIFHSLWYLPHGKFVETLVIFVLLIESTQPFSVNRQELWKRPNDRAPGYLLTPFFVLSDWSFAETVRGLVPGVKALLGRNTAPSSVRVEPQLEAVGRFNLVCTRV